MEMGRAWADKNLAAPYRHSQDEFLNTDPLNEMLRELRVSHVFTCAAEPDWDAIYGPLLAEGVRLTRVLTGYVEPATVARIEKQARRNIPRDIDIGYRSWQPEPWSGARHSRPDAEVSRRAQSRASASTSQDHMRRCSACLVPFCCAAVHPGVEGGASTTSATAAIRTASDARWLRTRGRIEETRRVFPGPMDASDAGNSPRHREAAAKGLQILIRGRIQRKPGAERQYFLGGFGTVARSREVAAARMGSTVAERDTTT